ncbi:hypothetical protein B0T24DRAFT_64253 [Lasiosphaeria ovina]|uniref:Secreted protein n=1 Tax=Lasiosphaeria ovina TaxID=92902 RepID=A0AAE0NLN2_9PEZI|nr:hypothetical protein B0T24DRAFT_64253 [Lasiosphaeria ovina]
MERGNLGFWLSMIPRAEFMLLLRLILLLRTLAAGVSAAADATDDDDDDDDEGRATLVLHKVFLAYLICVSPTN